MPLKEAGNGKIWRGVVLTALCGLIYLLSYDQGRQSIKPQVEELRRERALETAAREGAERRLREALSACEERSAARDGAPLDRLSLRVRQSRILFNGRLVVTLLDADQPGNLATLQFNFIKEEELLLKKLAAGGSFRFNLDGRSWALVVGSLSTSAASLNLVELKEP